MAIFYTDSGSFNNLTVTGSVIISASRGTVLQLKSSGSTIFSVSGSSGEIFNISDAGSSTSLFALGSGSVDILNIDNTKKVSISGSLVVTGSITGSLEGTASYALTASYAMNGGVTQILQGSNITVSGNGTGQVTISSTGGGSSYNTATGSYGSFYSTVTQTNVASTARSMSLNVTDISNGVSISGSIDPFNTYIKTENAGIYNIQFSAQVDKTDSGTDEIWVWLRKNGSNIADSATSIQLVGNGSHYVAAWNFFVNSSANDYYQLMWYSPDANVRLHAEAGFGVVPGIPSLIVTVNRVDQFLSNTGSFSGSFTGVFTGSLQGTATTASYISPTFISASAAASGFGSGGGGDTSGLLSTASFNSYTSSVTSQFAGTASYATTASYVTASNVAGTVTSASNALTASSVVGATPTEIGYLSGSTSNLQIQLNGRLTSDATVLGYNDLGSAIKGYPLGINLTAANTSTGFTNQRLWLAPVYVPADSVITGVRWLQIVLGNYTANNYNGVGLYTVSGGTINIAVSSSNNGNIWKTFTANTWGSQSFDAPYSASKGSYFIGAVLNASATVTTPTVGNATSAAATVQSFDFTGGRLYNILATQLTMPTSVALSTTTGVTTAWYFALY